MSDVVLLCRTLTGDVARYLEQTDRQADGQDNVLSQADALTKKSTIQNVYFFLEEGGNGRFGPCPCYFTADNIPL